MPGIPATAFAPLCHPAFRALWIATLASNTGLWVQNTGAGWLMTSLAPSPAMVSLVQAASMLPVFLFALPGGAFADILDRRVTLICRPDLDRRSWAVARCTGGTGSTGPLGPVGADVHDRRGYRCHLPGLGRSNA